MTADKLGQPPPIVQAMLLADHVYLDKGTGKRYILGIYSGVVTSKFPHSIPDLCLLLMITNGHGSTRLRLRIIDMDEELGSLHESMFPANMPNPNAVYYFTFHVSVIIPAPGVYRVQVFADNDLLHELRLQVKHRAEISPPAYEP